MWTLHFPSQNREGHMRFELYYARKMICSEMHILVQQKIALECPINYDSYLQRSCAGNVENDSDLILELIQADFLLILHHRVVIC